MAKEETKQKNVQPEEIVGGTNSSEANKTFSMEDVRSMMAEFATTLETKIRSELAPEPQNPMVGNDKPEKIARLARYNGKFVVDFKDQNVDPYVDKVIHAYNKWDERERVYKPWIELVYEDKTTEHVPLSHFLDKSVGVPFGIKETKVKDTSYSLGEVEKQIVKGYNQEGTGLLVNQKVTQAEYRFVLNGPKGEEFEVPDYVINIGSTAKLK